MIRKGKEIINTIGFGLRDAFRIDIPCIYLYISPIIRDRIWKCILMNGVIFLGSLIIFEYILIPILLLLLNCEISTESYIKSIIIYVFHIIWIYPIYFISLILNSDWYLEIANTAQDILNKNEKKPITISKHMTYIAESIYQAILFTCILLQIKLLSFIPILGPTLSAINLSCISGYYCFEYKFLNMSLYSKIDYCETHWAYLLGFGIPLTAITLLLPNFIGLGLYSVLFPIFVLTSLISEPDKYTFNKSYPKLKLFMIPDTCIKFFFKRLKKRFF